VISVSNPLLTVDLIAQFGLILDGDQIENVLGEHYAKIAELSLRVLGNMSMNQEGKQQCIDNNIIVRCYKFITMEGA